MRKLLLTLGFSALQLTAIAAIAQGTGTVDPAQGKARPTQETTSEERAAARSERRVEGGEAARGPQIGEAQTTPAAGPSPTVPREDRKAANEKRRAANSKANKAGDLPRGGSNQ